MATWDGVGYGISLIEMEKRQDGGSRSFRMAASTDVFFTLDYFELRFSC